MFFDNYNTKILVSKIIAKQIDIKILTWHIYKNAFLCIGFTIVDDFDIMLSGKINSIINTSSFIMLPNIIIFSNISIKIFLHKYNSKEYFSFAKFIKNFIILKKKNKIFYTTIKNK